MKRKSATISVIFLSFILQSCHSTNSQTIETQNSNYVPPAAEITPKPKTTIKVSSNGKAEFKGVSFTYDSKVFGEVEAEEISEYLLEREEDRPFTDQAQHLRFIFDNAGKDREIELQIFPVKSFSRVFAVNQDYVNAINKQFENLKKVTKDESFRVNNQIPIIFFGNGSQELTAKGKSFSFQNGKGIIFVTHWGYEMALISNENLEYVFAGLTGDEEYYVFARSPINVDFLPTQSPEEFEGYKIKYKYEDYPNPDNIKPRYKKYVSSIAERLDKLPSSKFKPDLKYFEEIISSLEIER